MNAPTDEVKDAELQLELPVAPTLDQVKISVIEAIHSTRCVSCERAIDHLKLQPHVVVEYHRHWEIYKQRGSNGTSRMQRHPRLYFHLTCFRQQPKKFVETTPRKTWYNTEFCQHYLIDNPIRQVHGLSTRRYLFSHFQHPRGGSEGDNDDSKEESANVTENDENHEEEEQEEEEEMEDIPVPVYVRVGEAAKLLHKNRQTIRAWADQGKILHQLVGRERLIDIEDAEHYRDDVDAKRRKQR
jgi:excisionase family DNA binding protein